MLICMGDTCELRALPKSVLVDRDAAGRGSADPL